MSKIPYKEILEALGYVVEREKTPSGRFYIDRDRTERITGYTHVDFKTPWPESSFPKEERKLLEKIRIRRILERDAV